MTEERCVCCGAVIPEGNHVCPKCRAEGLLDTYYDCKTTMLKETEWMANSHTKSRKVCEVNGQREDN